MKEHGDPVLFDTIRQGEGFAFFDAQSKARRKKVGAHKKSVGAPRKKAKERLTKTARFLPRIDRRGGFVV